MTNTDDNKHEADSLKEYLEIAYGQKHQAIIIETKQRLLEDLTKVFIKINEMPPETDLTNKNIKQRILKSVVIPRWCCL